VKQLNVWPMLMLLIVVVALIYFLSDLGR